MKDCPTKKNRNDRVNEAELEEDEANEGAWEEVDEADLLDLPDPQDDEVGKVEADVEDEFGCCYLEGFTTSLDALPAEKRKLDEDRAK